jgi:hypothetical protein
VVASVYDTALQNPAPLSASVYDDIVSFFPLSLSILQSQTLDTVAIANKPIGDMSIAALIACEEMWQAIESCHFSCDASVAIVIMAN